MRTRAHERNDGVGDATKNISTHVSAIARLELKLALLELKEKAAALGTAAGLGAAAVVFALFGLAALIATAAIALSLVLATWLAVLLLATLLLAIAGILGAGALTAAQKGTPPIPARAIKHAKLTANAVKGNGSY
jgi:uncharacterized membrane protein YqjE